MDQLETIAGRPALLCAPQGPQLATGRDASDLIGDALSLGADLIVIPTSRLSADFLRLSTGLAGEVLQKFVNYRLTPVILGDISSAVAASNPLRDFVRESNRGRSVWFVPDRATLENQLAAGF